MPPLSSRLLVELQPIAIRKNAPETNASRGKRRMEKREGWTWPRSIVAPARASGMPADSDSSRMRIAAQRRHRRGSNVAATQQTEVKAVIRQPSSTTPLLVVVV